ncbi:MAG TPA: DUF2892 domain-containing protein [Candidatus Nitrosotalea sp.]|nr:DUF2892 domain-containing protein [Candidatus Nitrosotalea sp.]
MATLTRARFVDVVNPALAIDCPGCGLVTARFLPYCSNCGRSIWPSGSEASAAFRLWRAADPVRVVARQYDLEIPLVRPPDEFDYSERAHELGIHIFPNSSWPFPICFGLFFLGLAAVPLATPARIVLGVIGAAIFLTGVVGWVVVEDQKMYPRDDAEEPGSAHVDQEAV